MSKFCFSTVVSLSYVYKVIALYDSLTKHCKDFHLYCLCFNEDTRKVLADCNWENITLLLPEQIEDADLKAARLNRNYHQYCWTLKPAVLYYAMCAYPDAQYYAHLDSDLYFFSNPEEIFNETPSASLFLTDHHNSKRFEHYYRLSGRYNTGFVGCKKDIIALNAIKWWRTKCIEYCGICTRGSKRFYGDQLYAEDIKRNFPNVHVVKSVGANTALWNIEKFKISVNNSKIYINNSPLVFYHFSGLSVFNELEYNLCYYYRINNQNVIDHIYKPYISSISSIIIRIRNEYPDLKITFAKRETTPKFHYYSINQ